MRLPPAPWFSSLPSATDGAESKAASSIRAQRCRLRLKFRLRFRRLDWKIGRTFCCPCRSEFRPALPSRSFLHFLSPCRVQPPSPPEWTSPLGPASRRAFRPIAHGFPAPAEFRALQFQKSRQPNLLLSARDLLPLSCVIRWPD